MALLCLARLLIAAVPLRIWRRHLGGRAGARGDSAQARRLAVHVARAAWRLPVAGKCLPQAMALSWQLRARGIAHEVVIAVRPAAQRGSGDDLHAWLACDAELVLGALPGPWVPLHRFGS